MKIEKTEWEADTVAVLIAEEGQRERRGSQQGGIGREELHSHHSLRPAPRHCDFNTMHIAVKVDGDSDV